MKINLKKIENILDDLLKEKIPFLNETHFQMEFATKIKKELGDNAKVYLEYPMDLREVHKRRKISRIDIIIEFDGKCYPIELKYKTKAGSENETVKYRECEFYIKNDLAYTDNIKRYINDIIKIKGMKKNENIKFESGYAIMLTNAEYYSKDNKLINNCNHDDSIKDYKVSKSTKVYSR